MMLSIQTISPRPGALHHSRADLWKPCGEVAPCLDDCARCGYKPPDWEW